MVKGGKKQLHINEVRLRILKRRLRETNDQAIKYALGEITEKEYLPIKVQRKVWEEKINELKSILKKENPENE